MPAHRYALQELEHLTAGVIPVLRPLLAAHLEDLQDKLQPGLLVLTWTSLNIDGYLHRFDQVGSTWQDMHSSCILHSHVGNGEALIIMPMPTPTPPLPTMQCLARTEELVRKAVDIHDNRVQANLGGVAGMCLLDLPADQSFTYDEFVAQQVLLGAVQGCCTCCHAS